MHHLNDNAKLFTAAFGRLCVETAIGVIANVEHCQPPSGGCVLKQINKTHNHQALMQPPSGGCVLKRSI